MPEPDLVRGLTLRRQYAWLTTTDAHGRAPSPRVEAIKPFEERTWPSGYRGLLAIHAGTGWERDDKTFCAHPAIQAVLARFGITDGRTLPTGVILGVCRMTACERITPDFVGPEPERSIPGCYVVGSYVFHLQDMCVLPEPIPYLGALGFWKPRPDVAARLVAFARTQPCLAQALPAIARTA
jgi:hypothetical protein